MKRSMVAAVTLLALAVQGCSMFGASEKPALAAAPPATTADAAAQPAAKAPETMRLSRFDASRDGRVTKPELEQVLTADFKKEDVNGNEVLDTAEARVVNERLRESPGSSPVFDWNGDGRLVYSEFASQWRTLFDRADRNGDGIVDEEEIKFSGRERKPRPLPEPTFSGKDGRPPGSPN